MIIFSLPAKVPLFLVKNHSYFFVIQENNRIFALKFIETLRK